MPAVEPENGVALKEMGVVPEVNDVLQDRKPSEEPDHAYPSRDGRMRWNQCANAVTAIVMTAAER